MSIDLSSIDFLADGGHQIPTIEQFKLMIQTSLEKHKANPNQTSSNIRNESDNFRNVLKIAIEIFIEDNLKRSKYSKKIRELIETKKQNFDKRLDDFLSSTSASPEDLARAAMAICAAYAFATSIPVAPVKKKKIYGQIKKKRTKIGNDAKLKLLKPIEDIIKTEANLYLSKQKYKKDKPTINRIATEIAPLVMEKVVLLDNCPEVWKQEHQNYINKKGKTVDKKLMLAIGRIRTYLPKIFPEYAKSDQSKIIVVEK
jgi:hypothetical protein